MTTLAAGMGITQETAATPSLDILFSVFPLEGGGWKGIYYAPDGNPESGVVELEFNRLERSIEYEYAGPPLLRFFRIRTSPEGEVSYPIVGSVTFNPEDVAPKHILFFEVDEREEGPYLISGMVDSEETFPNESLVFFNTMKVPFMGALGDKQFTLAPGASPPIHVDQYLGQEVPVILAIHDGEDMHLVAKNKIWFNADRRSLVILRRPKREGSLRIRTQRITEFTKTFDSEDVVEETLDSRDPPSDASNMDTASGSDRR